LPFLVAGCRQRDLDVAVRGHVLFRLSERLVILDQQQATATIHHQSLVETLHHLAVRSTWIIDARIERPRLPDPDHRAADRSKSAGIRPRLGTNEVVDLT